MALSLLMIAASFVSGVIAAPLIVKSDGSARAATPSSLKTLGTEIEIIPSLAVSSSSGPYTVVNLLSVLKYDFRFVFNPVGVLQTISKAELVILSQDCSGCPSRVDYSFSLNGATGDGNMTLPGKNLQGPVTHVTNIDSRVASAIRPGINAFTLDLDLDTTPSGSTLTDFNFGTYRITLLVEYQATS